MRKLALTLAVIALVAWPASRWLVGRQVEESITRQNEVLRRFPNVKVLGRDYRRGILTSEDTTTVEVTGFPMPGSASQPVAAAKAPPFQLTLRSTISHGPLFALGSLGAARIESELVWDEKTGAVITKLFGSSSPFRITTVVGFGDTIVVRVTSDALQTSFVPSSGRGEVRIDWEGLVLESSVSGDGASYTFDVKAPKLEVDEKSGPRVAMTGLRMNGDSRRIGNGEGAAFSGSQAMSLDELTVDLGTATGKTGAGRFHLADVEWEMDMPVDGERTGIETTFGADTIDVNGVAYGPARLGFALRHLPTATLARLREALRRAPEQWSALVSGSARELLGADPELSLAEATFTSPDGRLRCSAELKTRNAVPEDFANPLRMLARLDANVELEMPEAWATRMAGGVPAQLLLAQFSQAGYVARDGGMLKTKLVARDGRLMINGKPFSLPGSGGASPFTR